MLLLFCIFAPQNYFAYERTKEIFREKGTETALGFACKELEGVHGDGGGHPELPDGPHPAAAQRDHEAGGVPDAGRYAP